MKVTYSNMSTNRIAALASGISRSGPYFLSKDSCRLIVTIFGAVIVVQPIRLLYLRLNLLEMISGVELTEDF